MIRKIICALVMAVAMSACYNQGNIGHLYGQWAIEAYTVGGEPQDPSSYQDYYWRFQGELVQIEEHPAAYPGLPAYDFEIWTGTWTRNGNSLTINFSHIKDPAFPTCFGLERAEMPMRILKETSTTLILQFDSRTYTLRKLH